MGKYILPLVMAPMLVGAPALAAEQCEKIQSLPIMYRYFACKRAQPLNFWMSDLSSLERKAHPEYSGACRKDRFAYRPHECVAEKRDPRDFVVIVSTFVSRKHFCNFTLPKQVRDNVLRSLRLQLGEVDSSGLQPLSTSEPRAFDCYYASLPPLGDALLTCGTDGGSCQLRAVTNDGEGFFELSFPGSARSLWKELLDKTQRVAARCV